jgi:hypothetical protein
VLSAIKSKTVVNLGCGLSVQRSAGRGSQIRGRLDFFILAD